MPPLSLHFCGRAASVRLQKLGFGGTAYRAFVRGFVLHGIPAQLADEVVLGLVFTAFQGLEGGFIERLMYDFYLACPLECALGFGIPFVLCLLNELGVHAHMLCVFARNGCFQVLPGGLDA